MNESQTELMLIDPALKEAGWGVVEGSYIQKQYSISQGRLEGSGGRRSMPLKADYILQYKNRNLAVIEGKSDEKSAEAKPDAQSEEKSPQSEEKK